MTSDEHDGEIAIRLNHYRTLAEHEAATRALGDLPGNHPFRMIAGWSPAGANVNVDMDVVGPVGAADIRESARTLMSAAAELFSRADHIDAEITDSRFEQIVAGPAAAADPAVEGEVPQGVFPSWDQMPLIDRALAVDYLERGREFDEQRPLQYFEDPQLATLPARYAHAHALHLAEHVGVPDSLSPRAREELRDVLLSRRSDGLPLDTEE